MHRVFTSKGESAGWESLPCCVRLCVFSFGGLEEQETYLAGWFRGLNGIRTARRIPGSASADSPNRASRTVREIRGWYNLRVRNRGCRTSGYGGGPPIGLEHAYIFVSATGLGTYSLWILSDDCILDRSPDGNKSSKIPSSLPFCFSFKRAQKTEKR